MYRLLFGFLIFIKIFSLIHCLNINYEVSLEKQKTEGIKCPTLQDFVGDHDDGNLVLCKGRNFIIINLYAYCNELKINCKIIVYTCADEEISIGNEYQVDELIFKLYSLSENTFHYITVVDNSSNSTLTTNFVKTLSSNDNLSDVPFSRLVNVHPNSNSLQATLIWMPVRERVCEYKILVWNTDTPRVRQHFTKLNSQYSFEINDLSYSTNYSIGIKAISEEDESSGYWISYVTPSCIDINGYNYTICTPETPQDLQIIANNCEILVTWRNVSVLPDYYQLIIYYNFTSYTLQLLGNETSLVIPTDHFEFNEEFSIFLTAIAQSGSSKSTFAKQKNLCRKDAGSQEGKDNIRENDVTMYLTVYSCILLIVFIICIACVARLSKDRVKIKKINQRKDNEEENVTMSSDEQDEYEVANDILQLHEIIGEGEFGIVRRALMKFDKEHDKTKEVAVKMLRDKATCEDKRQLIKEIKVMKSVGSHLNIVSLIGYCSASMLLVVEYCSLGDLQNYLRQIWRTSMKAREFIKNSNTRGASFKQITNAVSNILYENSGIEQDLLKVSTIDLISFARQIATGMEYLAKNRVIHRDLAARNVLLTSDRTAKISDFGLSRDVYEQNMYRKKSTARLPIKWMALESLIHNIFSTQSDVWSFGVLLWEIMTLGCCPYPSFTSARIFELLMQGYRMEKPPCCSEKLYDIMLSCWETSPQQRPSFTKLVLKLEQIMETESAHEYLQLVPFSHYDKCYNTEGV